MPAADRNVTRFTLHEIQQWENRDFNFFIIEGNEIFFAG